MKQKGRSLALLFVLTGGAVHAQPLSKDDPSRQAVPGNASDDAIIPDAEFDAAIPSIDDDVDAQIGSVADWQAEQQRLEAAVQQSDQSAVVADVLAAQDRDTVELLADPPINDREIDEPLPPLQSFDVRPFDESQFTVADDARATTVRYRWRIAGLDDLNVGSDIQPVDGNLILSRFEELSALKEGDGEASNAAMVQARLIEDRQLLADLLTSEGFFDAAVMSDLSLPEDGDAAGPVTATLTITPGPRYVLGSVRFDAPPTQPPGLIDAAFVPTTGEPLAAERILAAEANVTVELPQAGYPFVELGQRDILLDPQSGTGDYVLPVAIGPLSVYGDIVIEGGDPVFDAAHVATIARFRRGELYDSRMVDDLRQALVATGLLSTAAVAPRRSGTIVDAGGAGGGREYATLVVTQVAGPPRTLAGQAGYGTGEGLKVEGSWTHRNLFPPEGALIVSATAGTQEQGAGVTFRRSNAGQRDRTVELGLDALHSDYDAFEAYTGRLSGRISVLSTPIWQKKFSYSAGFELLATSEEDYDFGSNRRTERIYYIGALPGQVTFDMSDSLLDPTRGFRLTAALSPEVLLGAGTQVYGRVRIDGSGYLPVSDGLVLAARARIGAMGGAARDSISPSRRFYAGGGGSVRGFGYQELGPKDPDARPIGGRSLVEAAVEGRYRFGNYGIVAFVDGGQVYTSELPRLTDWRYGVGIGGRFYTNFGPIRFDVATPINRQTGESRVSVYISIGQAF